MKGNGCSIYFWKESKLKSYSNLNMTGECILMPNDYQSGLRKKSKKDVNRKLTVGFSDCHETDVEKEWCMDCDKGEMSSLALLWVTLGF